MIEVGAFARGRGRTFVVGVAACLLLLKALVVVLAGAEARLLHSTATDAAPGATASLCAPGDAERGRPAHPDGDRHCLSCIPGERHRAFDLLAAAPGPAAIATGEAVRAPPSLPRRIALRPFQSARPPSSRAPPAA
jgi:hypothetical protein